MRCDSTVEPGTKRWLNPKSAALILQLFPELPPDERDLIERRLLPPWQRRACRRDRRDNAVRELAAHYLRMLLFPSGRALARQIAADCRRLPPPKDPLRPLVDAIIEHSWRKRPPGESVIRTALAGLPHRREPKPFTRIVVAPPRLVTKQGSI